MPLILVTRVDHGVARVFPACPASDPDLKRLYATLRTEGSTPTPGDACDETVWTGRGTFAGITYVIHPERETEQEQDMNSAALDSWITGNYGEDSIGDDDMTIVRHDDGTFTEYDTDGSVIGYGDGRDAEKTAVHYHVVAGTVGCLPDGEPQTYETRRDAERAAIEEARDYREAGFTVSGNVKTGYAIDPINYLMVEACTERECLSDN